MNKFDIEIRQNLSADLWYNHVLDDPNIEGEKNRYKGLREPFSSESVKLLMTLKGRFEDKAITDYGINSYEPEDYRTVVLLYEYNDNNSYQSIAELINDLFELSEKVESISISLSTSRGDSFYSTHCSQLYKEYNGRIPVQEILNTNFNKLHSIFLVHFKNELTKELGVFGIVSIEEEESPLLITIINPSNV